MRIRFADIELDTLGYRLQRAGKRVPLRPKVFDLLIHLVRHRERVVPRDELVSLLWAQTVVGPGSLSGLVNELRAALGERGGESSSVRTVHARGYQFVAEVRGEIRGDGPGFAREPGAEVASDPWPSDRLLDEVRHRLSSFVADEIRPILVTEGLEQLPASIVESLVGDLTSAGGEGSRRRDDERLEGRSAMARVHPNRRMRRSRSRRPSEEWGAG